MEKQIILVLSIIVLGTTGCDVWKTLENDKDLSWIHEIVKTDKVDEFVEKVGIFCTNI